MKKLILRWFTRNRSEIFSIIFNEQEQTAIINALWRRGDDDSGLRINQNLIEENEKLKSTCRSLAKELT